MAKEGPFHKAGCGGEAGDRRTGLKVRVKDNFDNRQNAYGR